MRKSSFVGKFQVLAVKRLRNSYYGNPKWEIAVKAISRFHDSTYIATTATDAGCSYLFGLFSVGRTYEIQGYFSKSYNMIIETAKEVK